MKKRTMLFATLIVVTLFAFHYLFDLFGRYSYLTAYWDIARGRIAILQYGEPDERDQYAKIVAPKWGFNYEVIAGCVVSPSFTNGVDAYNSVMESYLAGRKGNNWKDKFNSQVDSLFRAATATN